MSIDTPTVDIDHDDKDNLRLAILEKMGEQICDIHDTLKAQKPPGMSEDTYRKTLRDVAAQQDALEWAHSVCKLRHEGVI